MCTCEKKENNKEPINGISLAVTLLVWSALIAACIAGLYFISEPQRMRNDANRIIKESIKKEVVSWVQSQPDLASASNIVTNYYQCEDNYSLEHYDCLVMIGSKSLKEVITAAVINSEVSKEYKDNFLGTTNK
jgi:uncharacterized protein (UPF0333 family)